MIRKGLSKRPPAPEDWDGGYGWVFQRYIPSPFEVAWREAAPAVETKPGTPLCDMFKGRFAKERGIYMSNLHRMTPHPTTHAKCPGKFPDEPMKFDESVFSRFEYKFMCTFEPCNTPPPTTGPKVGDVRYTFIEPLVGLLRHPNACTNDYNFVINKNYMLVDPWSLVNPSRSTIAPKPKVLYFDGGASVWDDGAGGASQSWFHRVYESICIFFTDWYMWEAAFAQPKDVFKKLPGHLKPGYRWFNIPLTTTPDSWDNPMNHMLMEARKEDILILKIDFDTPHVEAALIQQILDYPEVAELIDEMYFEHHVRQEIMQNYHGTHGSPVLHSHSLKLFNDLRSKGVRAHQWV